MTKKRLQILAKSAGLKPDLLARIIKLRQLTDQALAQVNSLEFWQHLSNDPDTRAARRLNRTIDRIRKISTDLAPEVEADDANTEPATRP